MGVLSKEMLTYAIVACAAISFVVVVVQMIKCSDSRFVAYLGPYWLGKIRKEKRRQEFENKILDLTMGLANAMKAGMALPQALEKIGGQLSGAMGDEIATMLREYRLGMGIADAISRMSDRMPCEDLRLLSSAVKLTTQTGGSLVDVMEQLVDTIRSRTEFQQKLRTLTAQGKFEALAMASAPLAAFILLYFCQPDLMQPLVTTSTGWIAIGVAMGLEIAGYFVIKKIVTIEV